MKPPREPARHAKSPKAVRISTVGMASENALHRFPATAYRRMRRFSSPGLRHFPYRPAGGRPKLDSSRKQTRPAGRAKVKRVLNEKVLQRENFAHEGTGGRSQENTSLGFRPAFYDFATQKIYPSRFADGRLAPFHMLDGLPDEVVVDRAPNGRVVSAKATLISGFVRDGFFYTRTAAARAAREWAASE